MKELLPLPCDLFLSIWHSIIDVNICNHVRVDFFFFFWGGGGKNER